MNEQTTSGRIGLLGYEVLRDRTTLGTAASNSVAAVLRAKMALQRPIRVMFASAPSQYETLDALTRLPGIDWERVDAFHMDEYIGISANAPRCFGHWLDDKFFSRLSLHSINRFRPELDSDDDTAVMAEARRYAQLLNAAPMDLVLAGIGVNGHLAFNDPPADFNVNAAVQVVTLSAASRQQQVTEGLFRELQQVPTRAWTVTIPYLLSAKSMVCLVPGKIKYPAVSRLLTATSPTPDLPASALLTHLDAHLFLDAEAFAGHQ